MAPQRRTVSYSQQKPGIPFVQSAKDNQSKHIGLDKLT